MSSRSRHPERHRNHRIGWLRAAVLGANDGIVSTSCLMLGVAAANVARHELLIAGVAALVAGAMSMAAGEYVSVSSQSDTEQADLVREQQELEEEPDAEHRELTSIYIARGVQPELARKVATELMEHDALGAHARDELGIDDQNMARPMQAAITSALTFSSGSALPLATAALVPQQWVVPMVAGMSMLFLILLGMLAARAGGASVLRAALRVGFWGAFAMGVTTGVGHLFGVAA
ncbi:MAG TPA: VIT family protein [Oxalicibacterium sp.]|jgi:VIT1/CCC1 family predicted Fe2+/Mn2+ transporter|nr:VIT family protein [Oxalicibacterium sp.]